jgi:hypothetical protein
MKLGGLSHIGVATPSIVVAITLASHYNDLVM